MQKLEKRLEPVVLNIRRKRSMLTDGFENNIHIATTLDGKRQLTVSPELYRRMNQIKIDGLGYIYVLKNN